MCLIEGSLYTSKGLLLFHIVNTTVTLIFSFYLLSLSHSYSVFRHIFSMSVKSTAIIPNQDVFPDFPNTGTMLSCSAGREGHCWEIGVITLCVSMWVWKTERCCSGCLSVNLAALCGTLNLFYKEYFSFAVMFFLYLLSFQLCLLFPQSSLLFLLKAEPFPDGRQVSFF